MASDEHTPPDDWTPAEARMWWAFRAGRVCDLRTARDRTVSGVADGGSTPGGTVRGDTGDPAGGAAEPGTANGEGGTAGATGAADTPATASGTGASGDEIAAGAGAPDGAGADPAEPGPARGSGREPAHERTNTSPDRTNEAGDRANGSAGHRNGSATPPPVPAGPGAAATDPRATTAPDAAAGADDPAWPAARTVRAQAVAQLLLDPPPPLPGRVGALRLMGVRISGRLMLSGGVITPYVQLDGCRFDEPVRLRECRAGSMRLVRCLIPRLEAARLQIAGDLHLPQCVVPNGIRLTDAQIGTDLLLNQLTVRRAGGGVAIAADGLSVGQDMDAEHLDATGEVSLRSARIGGRLSLRGASLNNPGGNALSAHRISVEHSLYLSQGRVQSGPVGTPEPGATEREFTCVGAVRLDDGRFRSAVVVNRARFVLADDQELSLRRIQTPDLRFTPGRPPVGGRMSLSGARVGKLVDAVESWPGTGRLSLRDFRYDGLTPPEEFPLRDRIAWLRAATPEFSAKPYERLASALRAGGEDAEAREVQLARQRRHRETLPPAGRVWGWLQDVTVGYGYRPGRAAVWMGVLWALGTLYFAMNPAPQTVDTGLRPHWNPALYALDLLLPVIDLGQDGVWRQTGLSQWVASALILLGWTLATTAAAGASRLLRRG